jgi:hypothetical protein
LVISTDAVIFMTSAPVKEGWTDVDVFTGGIQDAAGIHGRSKQRPYK